MSKVRESARLDPPPHDPTVKRGDLQSPLRPIAGHDTKAPLDEGAAEPLRTRVRVAWESTYVRCLPLTARQSPCAPTPKAPLPIARARCWDQDPVERPTPTCAARTRSSPLHQTRKEI
jgi:hypothetical protein